MDALKCSLSLLFVFHFPFQFVELSYEGERGRARRGTLHDAFPHGGDLGNACVAVDGRLEHETRSEKIFDLLTDQAVEILSPVEQSGQHEDFQRRIVCFTDRGDRLEQLIHSQERKATRVDGRHYSARNNHGVNGGRSHGRRRVDQDDIEVRRAWF